MPGNRQPGNIALCGLPRSGSSLLYLMFLKLVDSHWCQGGEYAHTAVLSAVTGQTWQNPETARLNPGFYDPFAYIFYQAYEPEFETVPDKPFISKQPYDIFRARDGQLPPDTDLLVTIRDPRDVLLSKHRAVTGKGVDDYFIDADFKYTFLQNGEPAKNGPGLLEYCRAIGAVLDSTPDTNVTICRYEDLLTDPDGVQQRLGALGIALPPGRRLSDWNDLVNEMNITNLPAEFGVAVGTIRPIAGAGVNKWQKPENHARIRDQFERFPELQEWLVRFGYEEDDRWMARLG